MKRPLSLKFLQRQNKLNYNNKEFAEFDDKMSTDSIEIQLSPTGSIPSPLTYLIPFGATEDNDTYEDEMVDESEIIVSPNIDDRPTLNYFQS